MTQTLTNRDDYAETDDFGYAMGFRTNLLPDGSLRWASLPSDTYYMSGHDGQKVIMVPSEGLVVVRMGFTPEADDEPSEVALVAEAISALG
jgi:CubicO group peptidase (beta-lactamase class C family)